MVKQAAFEGDSEPSERPETWRNPGGWLALLRPQRAFLSVRGTSGRLLLAVVAILVIMCTSTLVAHSDSRMNLLGKSITFKETLFGYATPVL